MPDLLGLSAQIIDSGQVHTPPVRTTRELSEVAAGIAVVESFSNSIAVRAGGQLVVFDTSSAPAGTAVVAALRRWSGDPVSAVVYTHGHLDHVGGSGAFVADAHGRQHGRPTFIAHARVADRLARYRRTAGWNQAINARQFGWTRSPVYDGAAPRGGPAGFEAWLQEVVDPGRLYEDHLALDVGGVAIELYHGRGETDDHTWAWLPHWRACARATSSSGPSPTPATRRRYSAIRGDWAAALRAMIAREPELLLPAHGLPIGGAERIRRVLERDR